MEVAWRGPADDHRQLSCAGAVFEMKKERRSTAWGVDAQKVVQLMMGQLQYSADSSTNTAAAAAACCTGAAGDDVTLDLLGGAAGDQDVGPSMRRSIISDGCRSGGTSTEFDLMELDPEQPRLPSDWRKCLDLKTGKMSFVNRTTGVTLDNDPRKQGQPPQLQLDVAAPLAIHHVLEPGPSSSSSPPRRAHEFLRSKKYEILREENYLKASSTTSSSSEYGSPRIKLAKRENLLSFSNTGTQQWSLGLHEDHTDMSLVVKDTQLASEIMNEETERSNPKLDLNLTAGAGSPRAAAPRGQQQQQEQSVCTMEMVQRALRLTTDHHQAQLILQDRKKRELPATPVDYVVPSKPSDSSSPAFSSLPTSGAARSEQPAAWSLGSPSTSNNSSSACCISSDPDPLLDANQGSGAGGAVVHQGAGAAAVLDDRSLQTGGKTLSTAAAGDVADGSESKMSIINTTDDQQTAAAAISGAALVMGACTRCFMYVILEKSNCKCPRCGGEAALVDFAANIRSTTTTTTTLTCTASGISTSAAVKRPRVEA
ncbi:hypothetical protein CY35_10G029500 [Sphagnum magellanicum]|nr:hypothetical protein CY35_10G029500 [Sphagnum magellanicum]